MNRNQQSIILTFILINIYYISMIINYIYIQKNHSILLSYEMVSINYYITTNIIYIIGIIIFSLLILNIKKYIKISKGKKNLLFNNKKEKNKFKQIIAFLFLEIISFIYLMNFKLFQTIDQELNLYWIKKGITGLKTNTTEIQSQLLFQDYIFLLIPIIYFLIIKRKIISKILIYIKYIFLFSIINLIFIYITYDKTTERKITALTPSGLNPIIALIQDIENKFTEKKLPNIKFNLKQQNSLNLISNKLIAKTTEKIEIKNLKNKPQNILFFLIESAGFKYVFNTKEGENDKYPMPFLNKLSKEGVWFKNMYSNAASTGQAVFAITTGLNTYMGNKSVYAKTLNFETINKKISNYEVFFEHASNMNTWFPKGLLKNNNMELIDMKDLIKEGCEKGNLNLAIKEKEAFENYINRFIKKVQSKKRVIGYYLNYNTHFPYFSYKKGIFKVKKEEKKYIQKHSNKLINKEEYYKSLNYYDNLIKEAFIKLKKAKILDNTIIIIMGDHGQSFGEHGIWTHGEVYDNIARIPTLIWQPRYIKHKIINRYTSQPDILPTMLDLLKIKYDETKIQGISLLKNKKRKYIFSAEKSYQLLNTETNRKIILSRNFKSCKIYKIDKDKNEENPIKCKNNEKLKKILIKFINYQREILKKIEK